MKANKIDAVILWVDGNDPKWLAKKESYAESGEKSNTDSRISRYRDWGTLRYLLRGIEKNMSWIDSIFLVTDNQRPTWLKETKKLKIVDHRDFIPDKYLPTFNSNAIELNLHRIKNLSEQFVLFNDDMFAIGELKPEDFFLNGKPKDQAILKPIDANSKKTESYKTKALMMSIINKYFDKKAIVKNNAKLWFSPSYGKLLYANIALYPYAFFPGFYDSHIPISHLKSTFEELWKKEPSVLDETCNCKTRDYGKNVSHWLCRYWNLVNGKFAPRNNRIGRSFGYGVDDSEKINKAIRGREYKLICINDSDNGFDFELEKKRLIESFEVILPEKSQYEK